jgi:hypothetical protein
MANIKTQHPRRISHNPSLIVALNAFRSASLKLMCCDMTDLIVKIKNLVSREYFDNQSTLILV